MPGYPANPLLTRRETFRQWAGERVRWSDTDLVGHTNNLAFGAFFETGRSLFLRRYVDRHSPEKAMFLPAQLIINFLGEAYWPTEVAIGTGVMEIGRSSCRVGQGLFDGNRCFGSAETLIVLIDEQSRRPRPIPVEIRDWLSEFQIG